MMDNKEKLKRVVSGVEVVFSYEIFSRASSDRITFGELEEMIEDFKQVRNSYLGYNLGNSCDRLVCQGKYFVFGIYDDEFCLWEIDSHGFENSLGKYKISKDEVPSYKFLNWYNENIFDSVEGIKKCSCCGTKMKEDEVAGHYFAGSYCEECWEGKYKAIEAAETYN